MPANPQDVRAGRVEENYIANRLIALIDAALFAHGEMLFAINEATIPLRNIPVPIAKITAEVKTKITSIYRAIGWKDVMLNATDTADGEMLIVHFEPPPA